jgi:hypothetical protein
MRPLLQTVPKDAAKRARGSRWSHSDHYLPLTQTLLTLSWCKTNKPTYSTHQHAWALFYIYQCVLAKNKNMNSPASNGSTQQAAMMLPACALCSKPKVSHLQTRSPHCVLNTCKNSASVLPWDSKKLCDSSPKCQHHLKWRTGGAAAAATPPRCSTRSRSTKQKMLSLKHWVQTHHHQPTAKTIQGKHHLSRSLHQHTHHNQDRLSSAFRTKAA